MAENDSQKATRLAKELASMQQQNQSLTGQVNDLRTKSIDFDGDLAKGKQFGQDVLGPEGLGRLGTDVQIQDVLGRYKNIADQGLSREEVAAERAQAFRGIESGTQTGLRSLQAQLARSGVKGAVAGQQLLNREMAGAQQKADVEQNLFLKSEQLKREGLGEYSQRLGDVKQFDLGQIAAEKDIMMQSQLGLAQIGSAERTARYSAERAKEASIASARAGRPSCFLGSNKVEDIDGNLIEFKDLQPGTVLKDNNVVMGVSKHLALDVLYNYKGVKVTGSHFVYHRGNFCRVEDTGASAINYEVSDIYVYNVFTTSGIIEVENQIFSDYDDDQLVENDKIRKVSQREIQ